MNDITILTLSRYADLFQRLDAGLREHEPDAVDKLLVRSGHAFTPPRDWMWVQGREPFNFSASVNYGWQVAAPDDVILIGDDVLLQSPFIDEMRQLAYSDATIGIVTPELGGQSPFTFGFFRRDVLDAVGDMDEQFSGYGWDDNDFFERMHRLGYHTQVVDSVKAEHHGGTSFWRREAEGKMHVQTASDENKRLFDAKWGAS